MRYHIFNEADKYTIALLLKPPAFDKSSIKKYYVDPLKHFGFTEDVIAVTAEQGAKGKPTAKEIKEYLQELLPRLQELGVQTL